METVRKTLFEALVLGVVSVTLALTVNAVGVFGSIKLTKNYFDRGFGSVDTGDPRATPDGEDVVLPDTAGPEVDNPPDHPYQEVSFEQVVELFNDPKTELGTYVFVDSRRDDAYEKGHIPGAIQADHYRLEDYIDTLLDYAEGAEKIIVYCNGGDCEDSIFLCNDLIEFEMPYESIYLFAAGWKAWTANNMPVETGRDEGE